MRILIRKYSRIIAAFILAVILTTVTASALSPDRGFTYDLDNNAVSAPDAADFDFNITGKAIGIGSFIEPSDVCNDLSGNIYIADKGNNRIVKVEPTGRTAVEFKEFANGAETVKLSAPEGITITSDGDMYICDTGNSRIIHLNSDGKLIRIIGAPKSNVLEETFVFTPVKIAVDNLGRIYVVSKNYNAGIIELTKDGDFNQIFGAAEVEYNFAQIIWRNLSTKAQKERSVSLVPNEYSNICVDDKNFIYACSAYFDSLDSTGKVKKLNALGKNILSETPNLEINRYSKGTYGGAETFVDVYTLGNGIYGLLDNTRGRVFVYNDDGDMLFEFGGKGTRAGTFGTVSAFSYFNSHFYIADSKNSFISVFTLTDYAKQFLEAARLHQEGDYSGENEIWKNIYAKNNNSICTIRNFGRVNFREGNYKEAMRYFKLANDREAYSKAFSLYRTDYIGNHFTLFFIGLIFLIVLFIAVKVILGKRKNKKAHKGKFVPSLLYAKKVIFRPASGFWDMKREGYGSVSAAITIFSSVTLLYAVFNCTKGFLYTSGTGDASFLLSLFTVVIPVLLLVISNWCVSNLMEGEGNFKYIFMGTSYALTPMLIFLPILLICSHIFSLEEKSVYALLIGIMFLWTVILIACSNMQVHNYTMSKTVLVLIITLLLMVIIVFLTMLVIALVQKIAGVGNDMIHEIYLRL